MDNMADNKKEREFRFNEDNTLNELYDYVAATYHAHYSGRKNLQATDLIIDAGHGVGFCIGNIIKYAKRYGKKGDRDEQRKDIMKILHYALILAYASEIEADECAAKFNPVPKKHVDMWDKEDELGSIDRTERLWSQDRPWEESG